MLQNGQGPGNSTTKKYVLTIQPTTFPFNLREVASGVILSPFSSTSASTSQAAKSFQIGSSNDQLFTLPEAVLLGYHGRYLCCLP